MHSNWRQAVIDEAVEWKGTPFHHKAHKKLVGCDCGGFIYEVWKTVLGLPHEPFPAYYAEDWALHKDDNEIYLSFIKPYVIQVPKPKIADIVVWKFGRAFSHGTIYMGNKKYIHAYGRTTHGAVMVSQESMFQAGSDGKRECRVYTLDEARWL